MSSSELDKLQADRPGYGTRSVLEASFIMVNATVGAGVIGLPMAFLLAGFVNGILLLVFVGLMTFSAIYAMVLAGQRMGVYKLATLSECLYQLFYLMHLVVADTIPVLLNFYLPQFSFNREIVTVIVSIVVIFPLNLPRSIGALASWSTFSVLLLPVMILTVLIRAPAYSPQHEAPMDIFGTDPIAAAGIMSFAFVCSQVAFNNFLSQRNQSTTAWAATSGLSTLMSWSISVTFALIGYLSFGKDVQSNIFSNFPADDDVINVGRLALGLSMVLTVPMAFYPARDAVQKSLGFETEYRQPTAVEHYGVTTVMFVILLAFGITVHSLGKVYAVVGGLASAYLAFIMPSLSYLRAFRPSWIRQPPVDECVPLLQTSYKEQVPKPTWWLDVTSIILLLFGSVIMLFTAISAFK
ncbi:amino acid transporter [Lichtheimia corymbifera JMRC:FSU:9682]|uniref:Amino acid transporter n=1 Tax=Lichtheimia corymbifera JMRC:FSU:9682 TaxID=1263082 RepID=A0A068RUT6_9FUNG|nr:amino acid transporter [Lichtheimia corymbifera JMRC:FSU:9682]